MLGTDDITSLDVDSNTESTWSGSIPMSIQDGNYYVGWIIDPDNTVDEFNEDNNNQVIENETVLVDRTAPSSSIFYIPKSGTNKIDKNTVFSLNAIDTFGGSGVNITYYQVDNGAMREYSHEFTLAQFNLGTHKISYFSIDNLQNIEEVNIEVVIKLDLSDADLILRIGVTMVIGVLEVGVLDKIIFFCNKFGDSVGLLESVGDIIENDPELNKYIEVVKIHDRGNDWILRDYYKKSIELKKAIPNSLKAETAYMEVMKRLQILRKACLIFKKIGVGKNFTSNIANIL
ncbi:hypothetical protein LCGC14_2290390 [marine sediment metagenome]|uniref:CARDB domain-containing protein n=1 Tax=marine sediment metagenome TaxID=412755 RepID=A0A0F9FLN4_9ZZZZ